MSYPMPLRGVGYVPTAHAGWEMWSRYDPVVTRTDMAKIASFGFNGLRCVVAAGPPGQDTFTFPSPTPRQLTRLADFHTAAHGYGLRLHVTLFDMFGGLWGRIGYSCTWFDAILGALRSVDPNLSGIEHIELKNEMPFQNTTAYRGGFDSGWPSGVPRTGITTGQAALVWAQYLTYHVRAAAPGVPVTVSIASAQGTAAGALGIYYNASHSTDWAPDWYDYHCYSRLSVGMIWGRLTTALAVVGGDPAKLRNGEFGCLAGPATATMSTAQQRQVAADYCQQVRYVCNVLRLCEPEWWILHDIQDSAQFSGGQLSGLLDTSGADHPAAGIYRTWPPGMPPPPVELNGTFEGTPLTDPNGYSLPPGWYLYKGPSNDQPIAASVDTSNSYQGHPSVRLTGSGASTGTGNQAPALRSDSCLGATPIQEGQDYQFSVALKASGPVGTPGLQVSWYDVNTNASLGSSGRNLTLTSSFAVYSMRAVAPANAYPCVQVRTPGNGGSIWAAGATWAAGQAGPVIERA